MKVVVDESCFCEVVEAEWAEDGALAGVVVDGDEEGVVIVVFGKENVLVGDELGSAGWLWDCAK